MIATREDLGSFAGVSPEDLVSLSEIAELLGCHKRTAQRYVERDDFPEPLGRLASGRVWSREDVERWGRERLPLPRPGRPRKRPE